MGEPNAKCWIVRPDPESPGAGFAAPVAAGRDLSGKMILHSWSALYSRSPSLRPSKVDALERRDPGEWLGPPSSIRTLGGRHEDPRAAHGRQHRHHRAGR